MSSLDAHLAAAVPRAYVAAFRWLGNPDESRDACQEAAARALSAADRYDPAQGPFYPWFYRILRNHCMDRIAARKRSGHLIAEPVDRAASAEGTLLATERATAVSAAVAALPDDLREMIELRHFQDLSYAEMAAIAGCPVGTVMSRLYRARKALREAVRDGRGFGGPHTGARR